MGGAIWTGGGDSQAKSLWPQFGGGRAARASGTYFSQTQLCTVLESLMRGTPAGFLIALLYWMEGIRAPREIAGVTLITPLKSRDLCRRYSLSGLSDRTAGSPTCSSGAGFVNCCFSPSLCQPIVFQTFANPLGEVCDTPWPNSYRSLQDFCSRAWCRLEVLLCATLPLRDGGFR